MIKHNLKQLRARALALRLNGLLGHWGDVGAADWVAPLIQWQEDERDRRSLVRRLPMPISASSRRWRTLTGPSPSASST